MKKTVLNYHCPSCDTGVVVVVKIETREDIVVNTHVCNVCLKFCGLKSINSLAPVKRLAP